MSKKTLNELTLKDNFIFQVKRDKEMEGRFMLLELLSQDERAEGVLEGKRKIFWNCYQIWIGYRKTWKTKWKVRKILRC